MPPIPLTKPYLAIDKNASAIDWSTQGHLCGDGPFSRRAESLLMGRTQSKYAFVTGSCTQALELSVLSLGLCAGDEVILPSFTFISTATSLVRAGVTPVFVDICEDTLNIDPESIAGAITPRTKAIMIMHYGGVACDMTAISSIARKNQLFVIEDAAHSIDAYVDKKHLGTLGDVGCFSFHETKNVTCGEGGAFLTNNEDVAERAQLIRHKGTDRVRFLQGAISRYSWQEVGGNFLLAEPLASLLLPQLENLDFITSSRLRIFESYMEGLIDAAKLGYFRLPIVPAGCQPNGHIFYLLFPDEERRIRVEAEMKRKGIGATFHYQPLHSSPYMKRRSEEIPNLPVTDSISKRLLRLPIYPSLESEEVQYIVEALNLTVKELG